MKASIPYNFCNCYNNFFIDFYAFLQYTSSGILVDLEGEKHVEVPQYFFHYSPLYISFIGVFG